jgi:hypothetical protein
MPSSNRVISSCQMFPEYPNPAERNARYDLLLILPVHLVDDCGRFLDCAAGWLRASGSCRAPVITVISPAL